MTADFTNEYAMLAEISEREAFEPRILTKAKSCPDWTLWERAIDKELETLCKAETWELTEAPDIIGLKWVFHAKKDAAGIVIRYKAHLITQGFSQVPGIDYFNTFTPVMIFITNSFLPTCLPTSFPSNTHGLYVVSPYHFTLTDAVL